MSLSGLQSAGQQAGEDWQLSQAEVYWPACLWLSLHTITDTKPLFRSVRDPSCEWTHCAHSVELPSLIMCEEGKNSLSEQPGTSSLLKLWRIPRATEPGLFFPFYSNPHRHAAIPLHCTIHVSSHVSSDCDASVGLCSFAFWCFKDKVANVCLEKLLQRIKHNFFTMQTLQSFTC